MPVWKRVSSVTRNAYLVSRKLPTHTSSAALRRLAELLNIVVESLGETGRVGTHMLPEFRNRSRFPK